MSLHPDALNLCRCIEWIANNQIEIHWHINELFYPFDKTVGNVFTGYFFFGKHAHPHRTYEEMLVRAQALGGEERLLIVETDMPGTEQYRRIVMDREFANTDTGLTFISKEYEIDINRVVEVIRSIVPNSAILNEQPPKRREEVKIEPVQILPKYTQERNRIVLVVSSEFSNASPNIGIYTLVESLCISLYYMCREYGYDLKLTSEERANELTIKNRDIVILLSVNGFWSGGYTQHWMGMFFGNLLTIAEKVKAASARCIAVCSAHSSEFSLYGTPSMEQLEVLSCIEFHGFHSMVAETLRKKGIAASDRAFPIPMTVNNISEQSRVATESKRIMLQFDTQARKNGEIALAALFDAYCLAVAERPNLKVRAICKSSAANGFTSSAYLDSLNDYWGTANYPGFKTILEGRTDKSWVESLKKTDIFLGLSSEEGVHYFIPEMWCSGAHIVLTSPGPCSSYLTLPEGIHPVKGVYVENFGTGCYNDNFMGKVYNVDYEDCVMVIKRLLLEDLHIKSRKDILPNYIDTNGKLIAEFLGIKSKTGQACTIERDAPVYNIIVGNAKWPR